VRFRPRSATAKVAVVKTCPERGLGEGVRARGLGDVSR